MFIAADVAYESKIFLEELFKINPYAAGNQ
jgi:hypothetical protein